MKNDMAVGGCKNADGGWIVDLCSVHGGIARSRHRVLGDMAGKRDVGSTVQFIPDGNGKFRQIDVLPDEGVFLATPIFDNHRLDGFFCTLNPVAVQLLRSGVEAQGIPAARREEIDDQRDLVAPDVVKRKRRPAQIQRLSRDSARLVMEINRTLDMAQLSFFL